MKERKETLHSKFFHNKYNSLVKIYDPCDLNLCLCFTLINFWGWFGGFFLLLFTDNPAYVLLNLIFFNILIDNFIPICWFGFGNVFTHPSSQIIGFTFTHILVQSNSSCPLEVSSGVWTIFNFRALCCGNLNIVNFIVEIFYLQCVTISQCGMWRS